VLGEDLIQLLLTKKWIESAGMMKMLLSAGAISLVATLSPILLQSCGKPSLSAKNSFYSLVILLTLITPFSYYWGITGLITSIIVSGLFNLIYGWFLVARIINIQIIKVIHLVVYSFINAILVGLSVLITKNILFYRIGFIELVGLLIIGLITFVVLMIVWDKTMKVSIYKLIQSYL